MAETIKKYKLQQKTGTDTFVTLHPETQANVVTTEEIKNEAGTKVLIAAGDTQTVLQTLARNIETATSGAVNDVKVTDVSGTKSVVVSGIATVDISGKADKATTLTGYGITDAVEKEDGKGLSTNDYTTAEKNKLAGITEGANKVEKSSTNGNIKIDGTEVTVYDDSNIATYSVTKDITSTDYAAVYHLTKTVNGTTTNIGEAINIPKDLVVKSGSIIEKDNKKYLQLVLNDTAETKIEVEVTDLVDDYTAGTGISITNRAVSINRTVVDTYYDAAGKAQELVTALENGQVATNKTDITTLKTTVGNSTSGLVKDVADLKSKTTNVKASTTNGNILVDDKEVTVYTLPNNVVTDDSYAHITVTASSVSDGTNTFTKYDDTTLAGRVTTIENKFTNAVKAGTYSVVQTNDSGIVVAAGNLVEIGTTPSASLVTGGIFFKEITD